MGELSRARDAVHAAAASDPTRTTVEDLDAALDAFAATIRKYACTDALNTISTVETQAGEGLSEASKILLAWISGAVYDALEPDGP